MNTLTRLCAGAAIIGGFAAVPAAAQTYYPPQQSYPQQTYPNQGYPAQGYQQGYGQQGGIAGIINQLLGNNQNYSVTDRTAVTQCATAASAQAAAQYGRRYGQQRYGQRYPQGYGQPQYNQAYAAARVTAITGVERRRNSVRVSGMMDSGTSAYGRPGYPQPGYGQPGYNPYNPQYGQGHAAASDLNFRCDVDYRGAVTNLRVRQNTAAYRR